MKMILNWVDFLIFSRWISSDDHELTCRAAGAHVLLTETWESKWSLHRSFWTNELDSYTTTISKMVRVSKPQKNVIFAQFKTPLCRSGSAGTISPSPMKPQKSLGDLILSSQVGCLTLYPSVLYCSLITSLEVALRAPQSWGLSSTEAICFRVKSTEQFQIILGLGYTSRKYLWQALIFCTCVNRSKFDRENFTKKDGESVLFDVDAAGRRNRC